MPTLQIEQNDDGTFGALPEPLQKFVNKLLNESKAAGSKSAEAKLQVEIDTLKAQAAGNPVIVEKLKAAELELSQMREAQALRDKNYEAAQKERDDRAARELKERDDKLAATQAELGKRDQRIRSLVKNELGIVAAKHGARAESIEELKDLLDKHIALDDGFQPFVQDLTNPGKPRLDKDQKPISLEGLVTTYLTEHPHHKASGTSRLAGRTGASLTQSLAAPKPGHDALEAHRADIRNRQTNDAVSAIGAK